MSTIDEIKAALATLTAAVEAFEAPVATPVTITEVDVKESNGTEVKYVPENPTA